MHEKGKRIHLDRLEAKCMNLQKDLKITPNLGKLLEYKRNCTKHVNRMRRNNLPRVMKYYCPSGRSKHGRTLKRFLDTWDRNCSRSGPNPRQIYRVIQNYCQGFTNLSFSLHLRYVYMYFLFNRTTLHVFVTYLRDAVHVHHLSFYKHQHDNGVRSKLCCMSAVMVSMAILIRMFSSGKLVGRRGT